MIELKNVSFRYPLSDTASLKDFSLSVKKGECVLLCGRSGCGKTTVTKLVNGIIPYLADGDKTGSVTIKGTPVGEIPMYQLSKITGSVFQNPKSQFFNLDTDSELVFALENQGIPTEKIRKRLEEVTEKLGIFNLRNRDIFSLSGGEKQLIALASVYMADPEVFVLDEPTANLDLYSIDILKRMLQQMKQEGKTILIAEHRLSYLKDIVDTVVFMEQGKKKDVYTGKEFFALDDKKRTEMGLRRLRDLSSEADAPETKRREPGVGLDKVKISYGKRTVLEHISFQAYRGDIIGITGNNGVGKTTLCRTICGLIRETEGKITYEGKSVKPADRQKRSYLIMQDVNHQLFGESVEEECRIDQNPVTDDRIQEILKQLDLSTEINRHPMSLSGGQKQRLAIAVSLLLKKDIYIFDEPTSGLDYASMCAVRDQIRMLAESGATVFLVTHDMELLDTLCNRCLFVRRDRAVEIFADARGYSGYVKKMLKKEDGGRMG